MSRFLPSSSHDWKPGALIVAASVAIAGVLGFAAGVRSWHTYLAISIGIVLLFGWVERFRGELPAPPKRNRGRLRVIRGGRPDYDLARDRSTDSQKYVM